MKKYSKMLLLGATAVVMASCAGQSEEAMFVPDGYELIWSDEFDGESLDMDNWTPEIGGHGWGNNELQFYTGRKENVQVRDGSLIMRAVKED